MSVSQSLRTLRDRLNPSDRMPVVFLGHGSPMNAIADNKHTRNWQKLGQSLPRPQAILVISAHWMTRGATLVDISNHPRTIHDFGGFPPELYTQDYPASGNPELAREVVSLLASHNAVEDERWGLDHGAWSVLKFLYPEANVPVFQISIDMNSDLPAHLEIGQALSDLRNRGVLILGSGNVVHNLSALRPGGRPADWAAEFDTMFANRLEDRDLSMLADRVAIGPILHQAHPTLDHYIPSLTIAGAADARDQLTFMNDSIDYGSLSMRSFIFHT